MKTRIRYSESGQALILLVFGMVVLLGFTALAIDGGMVYSDRRQAQNGADAAALSGAGTAAYAIKDAGAALAGANWSCSTAHALLDGAAKAAAITSAGANEFTIAASNDYLANDNIVSTDCSDTGSKYYDVRVAITTQTNSSLAHFVFKGPMVNTVEAIARTTPRTAAGEGNAIVSLDNDDKCVGQDRGMVFSGNVDVNVTGGGGLWSNSCMEKDGFSGEVRADTANYIYEYDPNGGAIIPEPVQATDPIVIDIPAPDCSQVPDDPLPVSSTNVDGVEYLILAPGRYKDLKNPNEKVDVTLEPGLYCFSGDVDIKGKILGNDVTLYLTGDKSSFTTNGTATVFLDAPPAGCEENATPVDGCPPALGGVLLYMDPASKGPIKLTGNAGSTYEGTVYAPLADVIVEGGGSLMSDFGAQVIGYNVKVSGSSTFNIHWNPDVVWQNPVTLSVFH